MAHHNNKTKWQTNTDYNTLSVLVINSHHIIVQCGLSELHLSAQQWYNHDNVKSTKGHIAASYTQNNSIAFTTLYDPDLG